MSCNDTMVNMILNFKPTAKRPRSYCDSVDDTLQTPPKKIKELSALDSTYVGSPREVRRMRNDLVQARNTIESLEHRIREMHKIRKELEILFVAERDTLTQQRERDRKSIEDLENQLQTIRKREMELKNELSEVNRKCESLKCNTDKTIEELKTELFNISTDKVINDGTESSTISNLQRKIADLEFKYENAKEDLEANKIKFEELGQKISEQKSLETELQMKDEALQKAERQIKDQESQIESFKTYQEQAKAQQKKLLNYPNLERENFKLREDLKRLKDQVHNKLVLEEEVHDLKSRLLKYKEQEEKFAALQATQMQNEMYLSEWRAVARGICDPSAPDSQLPRMLRNVVERLQQQEVTLMSDKVQFESQLTSSQHELKLAKAAMDKHQKHVTELQSSIVQSRNMIKRLKERVDLISKERDSYRVQLDSYEKDLTICLNPASSANPGANQLQITKEKNRELERIIDGYRDHISRLETDLQKAEPLPNTDAVPVRIEQVNRLQEEIDKLKTENEILRERRDELEIKLEEILVGMDQPQGRILHFQNNPYSELIAEREKELEKLQEEVIKLRRKVKNYEEGLEASKLGDVSFCPKDVQSLREKNENYEVQIQRLKDYFKSSMIEFRNVIYMLFGYKIDKGTHGQYNLTSMYAEHEDDCLCFQLNADGNFSLLENAFSLSLEDMVQLHLRDHESIPVFLSTITIDLFKNKTMTSNFIVTDKTTIEK